jgi:hypothetical protein
MQQDEITLRQYEVPTPAAPTNILPSTWSLAGILFELVTCFTSELCYRLPAHGYSVFYLLVGYNERRREYQKEL